MLDPLPHDDLVLVGRDTPVAGKGTFLIQRNPHVICVLLGGEVVDEVSDGWRALCQKSFDADGYPTFGYVDVTQGTVAQSLGARMRSAAFMRRSADRLRRIVMVSGKDVKVGFVIRTIMRAAGVGNVHLVDAQTAPAALDALRTGKDQLAEGIIT